jgi:hypothetical protein
VTDQGAVWRGHDDFLSRGRRDEDLLAEIGVLRWRDASETHLAARYRKFDLDDAAH